MCIGLMNREQQIEAEREEQAEKEAGMKRLCGILRFWKIIAHSTREQNESKIAACGKNKYFQAWKKFIMRTANKLMKVLQCSHRVDNKSE